MQYSKEETADTQADLASRILQTYLNSNLARVSGKLIGIEEEVRSTLSPDLPDLLAVIDKIELCDEQLVITDFKTARSMWSDDTAYEHAEQLFLYGHAAQPMAESLDAKVVLEFVVLTKAKTPKVEAIRIPYSTATLKRSIEVIRQVFNAMQAGVVYPNPSPINCGTCPYRKRCSRWHEDNPSGEM